MSNATFSNETWAYDVAADAWERRDPAVSPPPRNLHAMAYDPMADRVIVFGSGDELELLNDTWAYDYNTDTWTERSPDSAPEPRIYAAMAHDHGSGRMILFGGVHGELLDEDAFGDTWAYEYEDDAWAKLSPGTSPSPRGWHAMAYDGESDRMVMFGGGPLRSEYDDQTWTFDPVTEEWARWTD